jgi:putative NIF3 family GTP cyclohydrolase 1 type 2
MKVRDIVEHFLSRADWVNRETTVDRVIAGDAEAEVERCLVTWMPTFEVLRRMVERDVRLLVCHEPTFWNHRDERPANDAEIHEKLKFIQDHGLVVVRNHDCWDRWPEVGITWAWADFLGLKGKPVSVSAGGFQQRYDIAPVSLETFARRVAERCAGIGEPLVQVTGAGDQRVSRIGIGTGCGCDIPTYRQMGCDCSIVCDDGSSSWSGIQRAKDFAHPVIRVNHGTSEEPGMVTLAEYINDHLPGVRAEHVPHGSTFRLVGVIA